MANQSRRLLCFIIVMRMIRSVSFLKMFDAVLVTGARQVGKTTLLRKIDGSAVNVTLDDKIQLVSAVEQIGTFFKIIRHPFLLMKCNMRQTCFRKSKSFWIERKGKGSSFFPLQPLACLHYAYHSTVLKEVTTLPIAPPL